MNPISVKKEVRLKLNAIPYAWVHVSGTLFFLYQTLDFVLAGFCLNLQHQETLFCDGCKDKVCRGFSEKIKDYAGTLNPLKMLLLTVSKSTKDVPAKCNFARNRLYGRKIKKNLWHI